MGVSVGVRKGFERRWGGDQGLSFWGDEVF